MIKHTRGAAAQQYAIVVGMIAVVAILAVSSAGRGVGSLMASVSNRLTNVNGATPSAPASPSGQYANCNQMYQAGQTVSGVYTVYPGGTPTSVYCDMTGLNGDGGGWTLVMHGYGAVAVPTNWSTATNAINLPGTPDPAATTTYKYSDAMINQLRAGGVYRLQSYGTYGLYRYVGSTCTYSHTTVAGNTPCGNTYTNLALTDNLRSGEVYAWIQGIGDYITSNNSLTFNTNNPYSGNERYFVGSGGAGDYNNSGTPGSNFNMWVK